MADTWAPVHTLTSSPAHPGPALRPGLFQVCPWPPALSRGESCTLPPWTQHVVGGTVFINMGCLVVGSSE